MAARKVNARASATRADMHRRTGARASSVQRPASLPGAGRRRWTLGAATWKSQLPVRLPTDHSGRMPEGTRWKRVLPFSFVLRAVSGNRTLPSDLGAHTPLRRTGARVMSIVHFPEPPDNSADARNQAGDAHRSFPPADGLFIFAHRPDECANFATPDSSKMWAW